VNAAGEELPIDDQTAEIMTCDSQFIGDLESNALTRPTSHVPDAIRRKVLARDGSACVVPGCRATRNVDVHHLEHRSAGGKHTVENCCTLCSGHHKLGHLGRLVIEGLAPALVFWWRPEDEIETATTAPPWEFIDVGVNELDPVLRRTLSAAVSLPGKLESSPVEPVPRGTDAVDE
jgi:hypothetical protein